MYCTVCALPAQYVLHATPRALPPVGGRGGGGRGALFQTLWSLLCTPRPSSLVPRLSPRTRTRTRTRTLYAASSRRMRVGHTLLFGGPGRAGERGNYGTANTHTDRPTATAMLASLTAHCSLLTAHRPLHLHRPPPPPRHRDPRPQASLLAQSTDGSRAGKSGGGGSEKKKQTS